MTETAWVLTSSMTTGHTMCSEELFVSKSPTDLDVKLKRSPSGGSSNWDCMSAHIIHDNRLYYVQWRSPTDLDVKLKRSPSGGLSNWNCMSAHIIQAHGTTPWIEKLFLSKAFLTSCQIWKKSIVGLSKWNCMTAPISHANSSTQCGQKLSISKALLTLCQI